jgi:hypothetical protein
VHVREDPTASQTQPGNDLEQELDAWKRAGDGFAGLGVGATFAFTPRTAAGLELSVVETFPFGATVVTPSAVVTQGF